MELLNGLDPEQSLAVAASGRHILVSAPPGSGKTRVLTARFSRLVNEGVRPEQILAVTFTNRAAGEMRLRLGALASLYNVSTFHAYCLRLLKTVRPGFTLFSRHDQINLIKELGLKAPEKTADKVSAVKAFLCAGNAPAFNEAELNAYRMYQTALLERGGLDLDDLVPEAIKAMEGGEYTPAFTHALVDEFQDINPAQARLVRLFADKGASVFAIGDPDQAIYGFRGANPQCFTDFEKTYPGAVVVRLKNNYRSAKAICAASQALIANNASRVNGTACAKTGGGEVFVIKCADEDEEAEYIVSEIERLMGGLTSYRAGSGAEGARFSDFAVLYRANRQAAALSRAFSRSLIPFHLVSAPGPELKEFTLHIKAEGIGQEARLADFIAQEAKRLQIGQDLAQTLIQRAAAFGFGPSALTAFIDELTLMDIADNCAVEADRVNLMTMHASKGLEFRFVFIAGVSEGIMPLYAKDKAGEEEERRVFYVGVTRAKERLYALHAGKRRVYGERTDFAMSRFVRELPSGLVSEITLNRKKVWKRAVQKGLFD